MEIKDIIISLIFPTPREVTKHLAARARAKRLYLNLSQHTLSQRSGVSYGVLKKFEQTGQISLESLLKIALALNALKDFYEVFALPRPTEALTLDDLIKADYSRKRGRK